MTFYERLYDLVHKYVSVLRPTRGMPQKMLNSFHMLDLTVGSFQYAGCD